MKPVFEGRFIQQEFQGDFMGMPFQGMGMTGFNNVTGQYEGFWIDSMGTGMMMMTGTMAADGKTLEMKGTYDCPIREKKCAMRTVSVFESPDRHTWTMYAEGMDGKEFKGMEMVYTRVSGGTAATIGEKAKSAADKAGNEAKKMGEDLKKKLDPK